MRQTFTDYRLFAQEFLRTFHTTGAILPSSPALAKALTRHVARHPADGRPRSILEVGPGTGAVTRYLVERLAPHDHVTLVELNERFVERLRQRFESDPRFRPARRRVTIVHDRLEALSPEAPYDLIVSGLPLNNFAAADVKSILAIYRQLLAPGGTLSFFEYMAVRPIRSRISGADERVRIREIDRMISELLRDHRVRRDGVWTNVPPAWAQHVQFSSG
ncbi:MAG: methyltransferase domain-containing protein [Pirellulales bacterium]